MNAQKSLDHHTTNAIQIPANKNSMIAIERRSLGALVHSNCGLSSGLNILVLVIVFCGSDPLDQFLGFAQKQSAFNAIVRVQP
jgi:hypothetical protein